MFRICWADLCLGNHLNKAERDLRLSLMLSQDHLDLGLKHEKC